MQNQEQPELYVSPYYQSGVRYKLYFGCDRILFAMLLMACVDIGWVWANVWMAGLCLGFFLAGIYLLRKLGRWDPLALRVYLRSLGYEPFYAAASKPGAARMPTPGHWLKIRV